MAVLLVGASVAGTSNTVANYFSLGKFTAVQTGHVTSFRVYSLVNGNVKVAIYADSGGEPGARLSYNNTAQAVTGGAWNTLTIPGLDITTGVDYWLATNRDTNGATSHRTVSGVARYKYAAFAGFTFPDPAGVGFTNWDGHEYAHAAWGETGWLGKISGVTNPAKVMGVDVANIAKVKGVS